MPDCVRILIDHPHNCQAHLAREQNYLDHRMPGKLKESGSRVTDHEVFCRCMNRDDIFVRILGLSAIPHLHARHGVLKLVEQTIRNEVGDGEIKIVIVDEDDIDRLRNAQPKFASVENVDSAQSFPT
ncbi:MAG TPA: hypothetical protein VN086_01255 [Candidatus Paceibacterota bacterium]|nr:hypothetical protein [Candidatus Paceibacterota bacterium]